MPKKAPEMTALQVRRINQSGTYAAGGVPGLLLRVTEAGAKGWVLRVMVNGKRRRMGLGGWPAVSLEQARDRAREALAVIEEGRDPIAERQARRREAANEQMRRLTFEQAARKCHEARLLRFRNAKHGQDWISSLERYAFPLIGEIPVRDIATDDVLRVVTEDLWLNKNETASRLRGRIENVLAWAAAAGFRDPDAPNPASRSRLKELRPPIRKAGRVVHLPALPWTRMAEFMADLRQREGNGARALEFAILCASRSGEVRNAKWSEIDLDRRIWTIPAQRMKAGREHVVPLSDDAIALLKSLPRMADNDLLFPAPRGGVLSDMTLTATLRRMNEARVAGGLEGYTDPNAANRVITAHGFRSAFLDWSRARTAFPTEVAELALAHVNSDATRAAYARDGLLEQRQKLLAMWAAYCRDGDPAADVVPFGRQSSNAPGM